MHISDTDDGVEGLDEEFTNLNLSSPDPRKTLFPTTVSQFGSIANDDAFVHVRVQHPHGNVYPSIEGRNIIVKSVVDPDLYNAAPMVNDPLFNNLEGGVFMQAFSAAGRPYIKDESDWQCPERVTNESVYTAPFDIEQNFVSHAGIPGIRMWRSAMGNCFIELTVVKVRSNHHTCNANAQQQQQHQVPRPPFQQPAQCSSTSTTPTATTTRLSAAAAAPTTSHHHQPQPQPQPQYQAPPAAQQQQHHQAPHAAAGAAQQPQQQPSQLRQQQYHYTFKNPSSAPAPAASQSQFHAASQAKPPPPLASFTSISCPDAIASGARRV